VSTVTDVPAFRVRDLARRFSVSERTIRLWLKVGRLPPPLPFPGKLRWDAAAFEEWYRQQKGASAMPRANTLGADPLKALKADPAFVRADPAVRALVLALLARGQRAEVQPRRAAARKKAGRVRP
jgi:hypothetical protein